MKIKILLKGKLLNARFKNGGMYQNVSEILISFFFGYSFRRVLGEFFLEDSPLVTFALLGIFLLPLIFMMFSSIEKTKIDGFFLIYPPPSDYQQKNLN